VKSSRRPVGRREAAWSLHLQQLSAFSSQVGHPNARQRHRDPATGFALGGWLSKQREAHRIGTLESQRYQALLRLGVEFDTAALIAMGANSSGRDNIYIAHRRQTWAKALDAAAVFVSSGGDLNAVRRNIGVPEAPRLGRWLYQARRDFAEGDLPEDVAEEWDRLGLHWSSPRGAGPRQ